MIKKPRKCAVWHNSFQATSLPLVFALVDPLQHGEAGLFRVGDGKRFQFNRGIERGDDFAHRLFAGGAIRQGLGGKRAAQGEFSTAHGATAFGQFVFVNWHGQNLTRNGGF